MRHAYVMTTTRIAITYNIHTTDAQHEKCCRFLRGDFTEPRKGHTPFFFLPLLDGTILSHAIFCSAHCLRQAKFVYNSHHIMYLLTKWECRPDGKIFRSRSWRTDRAQRGPCAMTESQIFFHRALPLRAI